MALDRFHLSREAVVETFRLGENEVFRVVDPQQGSFALRIHKPGYQDATTVASELAWLAALAEEGVPVNAPMPGRDGALVQRAGDDEEAPLAVLFGWIDEAPASAQEEAERFAVLGKVLGRIHRHGRTWQPPEGFKRQRWDVDGLVGENHIHGPYRSAAGIAPEQLALFDTTAAAIRERIAHLREEPRGGWGLIHGDFGFSNAIVSATGPVIIDFDDCGWGWPLYDIAVAYWRRADEPDASRLRDGLLKGYERVLPFPGEQYACLEDIVMAQRLGNLGWFGKHADSPLAEVLPQRIEEAEAACRRYLARLG
jgi:Ser/Thr protein kinase RdoA (MazF antagonist)